MVKLFLLVLIILIINFVKVKGEDIPGRVEVFWVSADDDDCAGSGTCGTSDNWWRDRFRSSSGDCTFGRSLREEGRCYVYAKEKDGCGNRI